MLPRYGSEHQDMTRELAQLPGSAHCCFPGSAAGAADACGVQIGVQLKVAKQPCGVPLQADEYLAHLVGHEGTGSLLSALKVSNKPAGAWIVEASLLA